MGGGGGFQVGGVCVGSGFWRLERLARDRNPDMMRVNGRSGAFGGYTAPED